MSSETNKKKMSPAELSKKIFYLLILQLIRQLLIELSKVSIFCLIVKKFDNISYTLKEQQK